MEGRPSSYKVKWSNFHVTVNPNATTDRVGLVRDLRRGVELMVQPDRMWEWLKQYNATQRARIDFTVADRLLVERVRIRAAIERGGQRNHSAHVHMVIEVAHRTMVQIDKYGVQDVFTRALGWVPNVHVRFLQGSGDDKSYILKYITKEVPTVRPTDWRNDVLRHAMAKGDIVVANNSAPV